MHEMKGHFSPGPQYAIPGGMGGAPANRFGAEKKLKDDRWRFAGIEPTATRSMTAAQLGGASDSQECPANALNSSSSQPCKRPRWSMESLEESDTHAPPPPPLRRWRATAGVPRVRVRVD